MVSGSALRTVVPTRVSLRAFLGCRPVCVRACVRVCVCVYVCVCARACAAGHGCVLEHGLHSWPVVHFFPLSLLVITCKPLESHSLKVFGVCDKGKEGSPRPLSCHVARVRNI